MIENQNIKSQIELHMKKILVLFMVLHSLNSICQEKIIEISIPDTIPKIISGKYSANITGGTFWYNQHTIFGKYFSNTNSVVIPELNEEKRAYEPTSMPDIESGVIAADGKGVALLMGFHEKMLKFDGKSNSILKLPGYVVTAVTQLRNNRSAALISKSDDAQHLGHRFTNYIHERKELKLVIWNHTARKYWIFSIADATTSVSGKPKIIETKDGNVVIAYTLVNDGYTTDKIIGLPFLNLQSSQINYVAKFNVDSILKNYTYNHLWEYGRREKSVVADLLEDKNGDIVVLYKGAVNYHETSKSYKGVNSSVYIKKLNSQGELISSNDFNSVHRLKFLNGYEAVVNYYNIYLGPFDYPHIIENPKRDGYLIAHRGTCATMRLEKDYSIKSMDIPLIIQVNADSLTAESADFLPAYSNPEGLHTQIMNGKYLLYANSDTQYPLSGNFAIRDFQYDSLVDKFILTEEVISYDNLEIKLAKKGTSNQYLGNVYIWSFDINMRSLEKMTSIFFMTLIFKIDILGQYTYITQKSRMTEKIVK